VIDPDSHQERCTDQEGDRIQAGGESGGQPEEQRTQGRAHELVGRELAGEQTAIAFSLGETAIGLLAGRRG
jgi:hypothetical protein